MRFDRPWKVVITMDESRLRESLGRLAEHVDEARVEPAAVVDRSRRRIFRNVVCFLAFLGLVGTGVAFVARTPSDVQIHQPADLPGPAEIESGFPSPSFDAPEGWFTASSGTLPEETTDQPSAWLSTYDFRGSEHLGQLYSELGELPSDGIAIEASVIAAEDYPNRPSDNFPLRDLPLHLDDADRLSHWEGQSPETRDFVRYRLLANVDGELLDVSVYFGSSDPSDALLQSAAEALETLDVPSRTQASPGFATIEGRIAFLSDRARGYGQQIFILKADGSRAKKITRSFGYSSRIDWSPDGKSIVMDRALGEGRGSLVVVDVQTGEEAVVFSDGDNGRTALDANSPSWSPDASRIAFTSGTGDIYTIGADGSGLKRLTLSERTCGHLYPDWSPDGTRIAFSHDCHGGGVSVVPADGGPVELVTDNRRDLQPAWSPEGNRIAWSRGGGGGGNIFVIDLASGDVVQLTEETDNYSPSWSPNGKQIVFGSNRTGHQNIWVMNADGSDELPVTTGSGLATAPAWAPR